jgi:aminocarboxymuconate-semialdehyde decarboxylase
LKKLPHPPSHYLKNLYYDTALSYHTSSLKCTAALAGTGHMIFGTDCPYTNDLRSVETIEGINQSGFSAVDKEKIFYKNAVDLFHKLQT